MTQFVVQIQKNIAKSINQTLIFKKIAVKKFIVYMGPISKNGGDFSGCAARTSKSGDRCSERAQCTNRAVMPAQPPSNLTVVLKRKPGGCLYHWLSNVWGFRSSAIQGEGSLFTLLNLAVPFTTRERKATKIFLSGRYVSKSNRSWILVSRLGKSRHTVVPDA